jgi:hypothetical protein
MDFYNPFGHPMHQKTCKLNDHALTLICGSQLFIQEKRTFHLDQLPFQE